MQVDEMLGEVGLARARHPVERTDGGGTGGASGRQKGVAQRLQLRVSSDEDAW
ncbi:hypothetical protein [Chondromyces crocatus]|uniref:hypothetical protein n=1 Tax=Chondromyces crocatus TaxID=52 RepID=UPI00248159F5|nr:hypothetical protein [Chondromyces crocatus]